MEDISEKILETAGRMFLQYGVRSISMDDISRELGISKKTIYQFFKDKNEIVCLISERFLKEQKEQFDMIHMDAENAIEKLYRATIKARELFSKINPYILFDIKKYYEDAWELYLDYEKDVMFDGTITILEEGIQEGLFRPDINVRILATLRVEEVKLAFDRMIFPDDDFDFREVQIQILEHFFYGIVTEKGYALLNEYKKNAVPNDQI
jgi:AcrR family transcriptional regulator